MFSPGRPSPSLPHKKWEGSRGGVRKRKGNPSPCAPICLWAGPPPPGRTKNGRQGGKALTQERESSPLPSIMFAGRPFPRGRTRNGRLTGKLFAKREDPFVAHQFVRGAPIPSQAYEDWEANGEGVHRRKGKPSPCAPICLWAALHFAGARKAEGKWGRRSRKKWETFSLPAIMSAGRPSPSRPREKWKGSREGVHKRKGKHSSSPPFCLRTVTPSKPWKNGG